MFRIDPNANRIAASRAHVVSLIEALNQPSVAVPGHATQPAQAWVVGLRQPEGWDLFALLWLTESRASVVYRPDRAPRDAESYARVELEALHFMESMGFMVDNLNFRNLPPEQQRALLDRLPFLSEDPPGSVASTRADDPETAARIGRILGSF